MWEKIDTFTERMAVPGGWIVRSSYTFMKSVTCHQIFIADKSHEWKLVVDSPTIGVEMVAATAKAH